MDNQFTTRELAKMAMCIAIISVTAYITFPLPFSPVLITAATGAMGLTALVLTPKQTFITMLAYLLLGGLGLPILPGGLGGLGRIFGPTGGFYWSWLVAFPLISYLKGSSVSFIRYFLVTIVFSLVIVYAGGLISMMLVLNVGLKAAIAQAVLPFILGDSFKALVAAILGVRINKAIGR